jgi:hypothetical protein
MFFDDLPLEITCPKCGKQIKETVKWFMADSRKCPFCDLPFETTGFRRGIDEATDRTNEMLQNLQKSLGNDSLTQIIQDDPRHRRVWRETKIPRDEYIACRRG